MNTFTSPQRFDLVSIPGTPYVALAYDRNLTPRALAAGTIVVELEIAALPVVQALGPGSVVWDVGAFIGDTALIFADRGAHVVAFEPQVDAYLAALWNTRHPKHGHIVVENLAVGAGQLVSCNQDPMAGNLGTRTVRRDPAGVKAVTLSSYARDNGHLPHFVKIDVEGFEPAVILGGLDLFVECRPTLLVEIYPALLARQGWTEKDVVDPLERIGYRCTEAIGNRTEPRWDILCVPQ